MRARLERQPNGDACSAFYINESTDPLYVRDTRVEIWRKALDTGDFPCGEGVTEDAARIVVATFDRWVEAMITDTTVGLSRAFATLPDDRTRARLVSALEWMVELYRARS